MRPNTGSLQRTRLARKAARNKRRRVLSGPRRTEPSKRSQDKKELHEKYLDQVALDKLNGLERRLLSEKAYRALKPRAPQKVQKKSKARRSTETYRGARRNAERGTRRALVLRAERRKSGESRRDADRRRFLSQKAS